MLFVAQDLPVVRTMQTNANRFRCFISLRVGFLYTHSGALHAYVFPQLVGQGGIKRILYAFHLEWQPSSITRDIRQEIPSVTTGAETRQPNTALCGVGIRRTLVHV